MGNQCLALGLEVGVRDTRTHAVAGVRSDTCETLIGPKDAGFADGADSFSGIT